MARGNSVVHALFALLSRTCMLKAYQVRILALMHREASLFSIRYQHCALEDLQTRGLGSGSRRWSFDRLV